MSGRSERGFLASKVGEEEVEERCRRRGGISYGEGGRMGPDGNPGEGQPGRGGVQVAPSRWLSLGPCSDAASCGVAIGEDPWSPMSHL